MLQTEALTAGYGRLPVIQEMTVHADKASVVAIVGPNGSGKSTLLKTLMGLLKPSAGKVAVEGLDVTGWPPHRIARAGMAYVPQLSNVFVSLTVVENLEMGAFTIRGNVPAKVTQVLDRFPELSAARRKKAGELSGGQRNLLGVARALMSEPKIVLADEPTAGLSPGNAHKIWASLSSLAREGTAVVVVEQNVDMALAHADFAYVMVAGRCRLEGPSDHVSRADLRALFLGQHHHAERNGQGHDPNSTSTFEGGGRDVSEGKPASGAGRTGESGRGNGGVRGNQQQQ